MNWDSFGIVIAVGLTLAMYSFLYKDNPAFKIAENLYVGVALGYTVIITWYNALKPDIYDPLFVPIFTKATEPEYLVIVPMILGIFMLMRISARLSWLSRWSFAFVVGLGSGLTIPNYIHTFILKQIEPSMRPLFYGGESIYVSVNGILVLVGVVTVLLYFFFSIEHKGPIGVASKIGIYFLMVSFGASFGYTVMGRMSLLIGRMIFLLRDWLGVLH
ncbi:MAG: hypothetical protein A3C38_01975 [Planctomycetes bacterium RIFCSPHIGHO2_02_FULL_50_42]|nr:MAG: hypothetical protein A2060_04615 [Planctomycetes bacterium GWA2_50_13]OHB87876.1 MAG: hypothetical protein A3C38_01975 [Planctomycetes bacterium RIFCSPHIGHO2_02_FULL_50_42]OHB95911.1 MAG: hypothetical protein A3I59_04575 [Planctomycetes bacterium RIFCSPLOWO2_02_FULL_50_16]OHC04902.1 MAG: hypothetical protein A3G17_02440 [Planctomycetes bacterium RIFCSPLOWO2_12_FULL_50_35]